MTVDTPADPQYAPTKALVAVAVAAAVFMQSTVADGLSKSDWAGLGVAIVTATGVYVLPNLAGSPYFAYAKGAVAVLGAIFTGLVLALTNGNLSDVEVWSIVIQAAGAIGVVAAPNALRSTSPASPATDVVTPTGSTFVSPTDGA